MSIDLSEYNRTCFVIMPFGTKDVELTSTDAAGTKTTVEKSINFDQIYNNIFVPAIKAVALPETGTLVPRRTDKDFFTGIISREMFLYIEYSRIALTDITGLNANVFYELGARHRARETGTAIFRISDAPIPFDINQIKAFPYSYEPALQADKARELIKQVLTESLKYNKLDSPIREALGEQFTSDENIDDLLRNAEQATRDQDWAEASKNYEAAVKRQPNNPLLHFSIGLMRRNQGKWSDAIAEFRKAIENAASKSSQYAEAYRELGIAENKLYQKTGNEPDGIESLRRAVDARPDDYDALSSLGGALRRAGQLEESLDAYRRATKASLGHPYPLLNELKLEAIVEKKPSPGAAHALRLKRAAAFRQRQVDHKPALDTPWSYFDLAEINLYLGQPAQFLRLISDGLECCSHRWQATTFHETLGWFAKGLTQQSVPLPDGLQKGIDFVQSQEPELPE